MNFYRFFLRRSDLPNYPLDAIVFPILVCLFIFHGCSTPYTPPRSDSQETAWTGESKHLERVIAKLTKELVRQGDLAGKAILVSPRDLYDAQNGLSLKLAVQLRGRLVTYMSEQGVRVLYPGADEESALILQGTWQEFGRDLILDFRVMKLTDHGPEAVASASGKVLMSDIDPAALTPDRDAWSRYLVRELEKGITSRRTLHIRDFTVGGDKRDYRDFGVYCTEWLGPELSNSYMFEPLDQQTALRGVPDMELRSRGSKDDLSDPKEDVEKTSLTADLLKADAELKGKAYFHSRSLEFHVRITDRQGRQITAVNAEIPKTIFPDNVLNPARESAPVIPSDTVTSGLQVELTTTKGESRPYYRKGEKVRFILRLNRAGYVYLFDLDPDGNAVLLYPVDRQGRLKRDRECGSALMPNRPILIPEDGCSNPIVVKKPPYGKETIWAVASEHPLNIPDYLSGAWSTAEGLMKNIRSQGNAGGGGYGEAQVEVMTGP
ncbi:hypothetical protein DSCO28_65850 [Desulfosarcina ovata subsp. sediminis]|uniref:DUF4384 domain-containing protein n=1 Tax=Desulfosarcina ovata subsp. sediminis TaxID=885957 RepID=A0A5K8A0F2_9BACT|nr:DUF4384 domain-containing protein [Desulfosarcina ovata]BBO86019.1 hypothetical protein DSCO28_65850 [Desulfosarcina ovata subsp. sediminis]